MEIKYGDGTTKFGPGVEIILNGNEIAVAIDSYLVAHNIHIRGPRTTKVNGQSPEDGYVYIDPSGYVIENGVKFSGRGLYNEQIKPTSAAGRP